SFKAALHRFMHISFGGVTVSDPDVVLVPDSYDELGKEMGIESRLPRDAIEHWDMVIGMNVLRHLHIYIAYKEQKLYITPASPMSLSAPPPASPANSPSPH
ncbi:MAG TPA: hypothetical protein VKB71_06270, partial [Rhizomicrobium sp.]|nr:hypothetical protein [Rhizomicrobium sp.]